MKPPTKISNQFGQALRKARKHKGLSQEAFGIQSSRTYISTLERALKSPTLSKIDDLADVLAVHPLTLLTMAYCNHSDKTSIEDILEVVKREFSELVEWQAH